MVKVWVYYWVSWFQKNQGSLVFPIPTQDFTGLYVLAQGIKKIACKTPGLCPYVWVDVGKTLK